MALQSKDITVKIETEFLVSDGKFKSKLTVFLPVDDNIKNGNGHLHQALRDFGSNVFGIQLNKNWGHWSYHGEYADYRYSEKCFTGTTLEELNTELSDEIESIITTLNKIVVRYNELVRGLPEKACKEYQYSILEQQDNG